VPLPPIDPDIGERQTLDEIRDWYHGIVEALVVQRATVLDAIRNGNRVARRYLGLNQAEIDAYFDSQRRELDRLTMLNLVASAEASLKDDYFHRFRSLPKHSFQESCRSGSVNSIDFRPGRSVENEILF
jgi:hypothetical protein